MRIAWAGTIRSPPTDSNVQQPMSGMPIAAPQLVPCVSISPRMHQHQGADLNRGAVHSSYRSKVNSPAVMTPSAPHPGRTTPLPYQCTTHPSYAMQTSIASSTAPRPSVGGSLLASPQLQSRWGAATPTPAVFAHAGNATPPVPSIASLDIPRRLLSLENLMVELRADVERHQAETKREVNDLFHAFRSLSAKPSLEVTSRSKDSCVDAGAEEFNDSSLTSDLIRVTAIALSELERLARLAGDRLEAELQQACLPSTPPTNSQMDCRDNFHFAEQNGSVGSVDCTALRSPKEELSCSVSEMTCCSPSRLQELLLLQDKANAFISGADAFSSNEAHRASLASNGRTDYHDKLEDEAPMDFDPSAVTNTGLFAKVEAVSTGRVPLEKRLSPDRILKELTN